ncbi:MAG: hypothetical protein ABIJ91_03430 [Candidatus Kuenenbacteria bacterium]
MKYIKDLQSQYDIIYSYFKTTCEPYDYLEWDVSCTPCQDR